MKPLYFELFKVISNPPATLLNKQKTGVMRFVVNNNFASKNSSVKNKF